MLSQIPDGIWGVLIGSALALGGTYVATRAQLRHDERQRERDRKMQFRREVFLEAAEGVSGTEQFMKLANPDLPLNEMSASSTRPGWLNKLYMVASLESLEAFTTASATMAASTFDLFRLRITVENVKTQIGNLRQQLDAMSAVQERIREIAAGVAAQPQSPETQSTLSTIQADWDRTSRELERLNAEIARLTTEKLKLHRALLEQAVTYSVHYAEKLQQAWVALRTELDFPIDPEKLQALSKRVDAEMIPKFRQLLDAIDSDSDGQAT